MTQRSFSQYGQDLLLHYFLIKYRLITRPDYVGSYIDIGCNHPINFSNTYHFYELGWSGLCVDANPTLMQEFSRERPRDTAISCGVGLADAKLDFYMFKNSQHSTFIKQKAIRSPEKLDRVIEIPVKPLKTILQENNVKNPDFMSIDVEGLELDVLNSMDFAEVRPKLVILEAKIGIKEIFNFRLTRFMETKDYDLICHTGHDAIYKVKQ